MFVAIKLQLPQPLVRTVFFFFYLWKNIIFLEQLPGLKITYIMDDKEGIFGINLFCNQTAPHDAKIDFFVDGVIGDEFVLSGYSYYGI